jgi:hypothetical protein
MKRKYWILTTLMALVALSMVMVAPVMATEVTVVGLLNEDWAIEGEDGVLYEVEDSEVGNELLNHVGKKVEVLGTVNESEGIKSIRVSKFTVLGE